VIIRAGCFYCLLFIVVYFHVSRAMLYEKLYISFTFLIIEFVFVFVWADVGNFVRNFLYYQHIGRNFLYYRKSGVFEKM
jgi:hypothetical protein